MNKPTAVSFFCGAGGVDLGFIQAGFEILAAWDWDSNAIKSYTENIGDHANVMDIKEMTYDDIPKADVWLFGFPCQDLSVAGKQKGLYEGERSSMFFHVMRLLQETREIESENLPKVIMAENVKGLKPYLGVLEEEYAKQGYEMQFQIFNSKYWGVPQNRERYFVVGVREDLPQMFEFPIQQTEYVPKLSSILETEVDEKYYISDEKAAKIIEQALERLNKLGNVHATITPDRVDKRQNGRRAKAAEEEMYTLTAQDLHGVIIDKSQQGIEGTPRVYPNYAPTLSARDYKEPRLTVVGRLDMKGMDVIKRVYDPEGLEPTLTTSEGGHRQPKVLVEYNRKEVIVKEIDIAGAVTASDWRGLNQNQSKVAVVEGYRVRKLTPREYMRLQGFPEEYEQVVSNTQMYKQMGNAVTVPVAKGTALKIKHYLETI